MAVVLRLQGLNIEAGPEDIRMFFHGLPIPEGGVHIIGGKMGEAFIIFSTERAGQLAMLHSGKPLRGSTVTLHKSSMAEFKHKMELKLRKRKCATVLLSLMAAVEGLQSNHQMNQVQSPPVSSTQLRSIPKSGNDAIENISVADQTPLVAEATRHHVEEQQGGVRDFSACKPGYLRLYGLPNTVTGEEVREFLKGLKVVDVITDTLQGQDQCCLVKMANFKEAEEGLKYSCSSSRGGQVKVRLAHQRMWENAVEHHKNSSCSTFSEQDRFSPDRSLHRNSPVKRPCLFWDSPKYRHSNSPSFDTEYCVMVKNLSKTATKTEIRNLFSCPDVPSSNILHLLNKWKERTSTAFIIFTQPEDYTLAMNMNGSVVGSRTIDVSSITKEKMKDLMHQSRFTESHSSDSERPRSCTSQTRPVLSCVYARNFPADVRKAGIKDFFSESYISEEDVELLEDENGNGIGEAVIRFGCEERAREALRLHGQRFSREQILLTRISPQQMKDILHKTR